MHTFHLKILTPEKNLFTGEVLSVQVPTKAGVLTLLPHHEPLISALAIGEIVLKRNNSLVEKFLIQGGILEVGQHNSGVSILPNLLIDLEKYSGDNLQEEIKRAKDAMLDKSNQEDNLEELESDLERALFLQKLKQK